MPSIEKELTSLIDFWFDPENENMWFNATPKDDKMITERFSSLLSKPIEETHNPQLKMAYIILFDQIGRHVTRHYKVEYLNAYHQKAINLTWELLREDNILKLFSCQAIPFILLPLRHTKNLELIEIAKDHILEIMEDRGEDFPHYSYLKRFYKVTVTNIANMKEPTLITDNLTPEEIATIKPILDPESIQIIDYPNFENNVKNHIFLKQLQESIAKDLINARHLVLSISGGKDSMALATALYYLRDKIDFEISAVHINYMNRESSIAEENLVRYYVHDILGFPLYVRRITEIQRARHSDDRAFYEKITENIRFRTYKQVDPWGRVILGHNYDDTLENILTNILKKKHYDNLKGMEVLSLKHDVFLFRPILKVTKAQIEEFNMLTDTAFTYDSTPEWSDRGRLRDNVIPALKAFNPGMLDGLYELSNAVSEIHRYYNGYALSFIEDNWIRGIKQEDYDGKYRYIIYDGFPASAKLLRDIFDRWHIEQPSTASMKNLVDIIKRYHQTWKMPDSIEMKGGITIQVDKKRKMLIIPMKKDD